MNFSNPIIQKYLNEQRLGRLATSTIKGTPHIVVVGYVNDLNNIYFCTQTNSKKIVNIKNNKKVAFIVDDSGGSIGWRYVTVEGSAYLITDVAEFSRVKDLLCGKYPVYNSSEWAIKEELHTMVRIEPKRVLAANL